MKSPRSKPSSSRGGLILKSGSSGCECSVPPCADPPPPASLCELESSHFSIMFPCLVKSHGVEKKKEAPISCILMQIPAAGKRRQSSKEFQMRHKSFNKAYMVRKKPQQKQIIKGAHEMGQRRCTVHSRGVARKRYCWVSQ